MNHHTCTSNDGGNPSRRCDECDAEQMIADDAREGFRNGLAIRLMSNGIGDPASREMLIAIANYIEEIAVNHEYQFSSDEWRWVDGLRNLVVAMRMAQDTHVISRGIQKYGTRTTEYVIVRGEWYEQLRRWLVKEAA